MVFSCTAEKLDLQLCFVCFNGGKMVQVTLDMTCLKW
uniref:Uncharacterized protein n=1 Tax=Rhizophora mucronata TaxID=61149 RepID=A0A2P2K5M4_RHIMU